jgi:hypothetical protein
MPGRKRKKPDAAVASIIRPHLEHEVQRHRSVTVYRSATGRLCQSTSYISVVDTPPSVPASDELTTSANDPSELRLDLDTEPDITVSPDEFADTKQCDASKTTPLTDWIANYRQTYLDELLRHDGRAEVDFCANCGGNGSYKCKDCFGFQILCKLCFVKAHSHLPFHRALASTFRISLSLADVQLALDWIVF